VSFEFAFWCPLGRPVAVLRDALYDTIPLPGAVEATLATAPLLRLQGVKQLGFVYRVWPSATHTRFEHSLGVYHLMERALAGLWERGELAATQPQEVRTLLAAALLHDVGHYPFSHAIEELGPPVTTHERVGRRLIESDPLAPLLEREWQVSPSAVADLVDPPPKQKRAGPPSRALLSGALDVDKLDYLARDARGCNVPYGRVDVARLLESLVIHTLPGAGARLMVSHKGVGAVHSLISARQEMFDNVYWHHTNRACMAMLLRAVQDALESGALAVEELPRHDDASLLARLQEAAMPPTTRRLARALRERALHKRALELSPRAGPVYGWIDRLFQDPPARRRAERALGEALAAEGVAVADADVLLDVPKPERWATDVWIYYARPPVGLESVMTWSDATGTQPEQLARYEQHQRRVRVVTAPHLAERVWQRRADVVLPTLERLAAQAL
jgi:HD superfamily phosphohydrolase